MVVRIGLVDLDTSHPASWLPILRRRSDVRIAAVCDGQAVHDPGYAAEFAQQRDIDRAVESPEAMVDYVDAAIIHSCNWDLHLERAEPFIQAGKPVFLDKPIAGNMRDIRSLQRLAAQGADIIGGSSLRFANEVTEFAEKHPADEICTLFATCPNDEFNYGIHGYEMVLGAMGGGIESVRRLGGADPFRIQLSFEDGRQAFLQLKSPAGGFFFAASTRQSVESVTVAGGIELYAPLIDRIVDHFAGVRPYPLAIDAMLEPCLAALAALRSLESGEPVRLEDLCDQDLGYDGAQFAAEYRRLRRGA